MNRLLAALVIAPLAAASLASCTLMPAKQLGNPAVVDLDPVDARDMAQEFCREVERVGQKEATQNLATATLQQEVSDADSDAIVEFAYVKLCPESF